ncbi:MAG: hypothetical protein CSB34_04985 [Desulfobulbus propionicus]|nr:MAG: hypothetical protein CSB34_04985 [Desulfobulbus propionicus]
MKTHGKNPLCRVGIIGTGKHGSRYANHLIRDVDGLELTAISRRSEQGKQQAQEWHCRYFADWQELVQSAHVSCVVAAVPPTMNLGIAQACAQAGKPLLLEKPLAGSLEDARAIVALEQEQGLKLTTGQTLRYNAVVQRLKSNVSQLGKLHTFSANQRLEPSTLGWHEEPERAGAGVSYHTAVHVFDALFFITGLNVSKVAAVARSHNNRSLEDVLAVLVELEDGVVGTVDCSKVGTARSGLFEFVGENGQLLGEQIYNSCTKIEGQNRIDLSPPEPVNTIVPLLQDWQKYLTGVGKNPVTGRDGLRSVQICAACLEAAQKQEWVQIEQLP